MKKVCVLILSVFTLPVFGSGIGANSASAPCTNNTLETYSGNTNLQADWQPNTINLRWYNNNTLMDVQTAANTCVYDSTLTVPSTAPTRVGYTFAGWQVRPEIDFGTISIEANGIERWSIGWYNNANYCAHEIDTNSSFVVDCDSDPTYKELQAYEWKVKFEHGDLYGMSGCSTVGSGQPTIQNGTGAYCWCKATGYKPSNSNVISSPLYELSWVLYGDRVDATTCSRACPANCNHQIKHNSTFRVRAFTPAN